MREDYRAIKEVINQNFTFSDLSPRFKNVDASTGNIFCPFHENHETPAARMYWDENKEIWVIWCFGECHRHFTAYDYVDLILCNKYQKYSSPLDFLKENLEQTDLLKKLEASKKSFTDLDESAFKEKINYINNVFAESEDISDYIEKLYTK